MALLEATPKITKHPKTRLHRGIVIEYYIGADNGTYQPTFRDYYRDIEEIEYTWRCDDVDDNPLHDGTYGTGGWELREYGPRVPHGKRTGFYTEVYVQDSQIWYPGTGTYTIS